MKPLRRGADEATIVVTIREGRNRQVRKMCDAIGHPVTHLRRIAIGPIRDAKLELGTWRDLRADEVALLRTAASRNHRNVHGPDTRRPAAAGRPRPKSTGPR